MKDKARCKTLIAYFSTGGVTARMARMLEKATRGALV